LEVRLQSRKHLSYAQLMQQLRGAKDTMMEMPRLLVKDDPELTKIVIGHNCRRDSG